MANLLNPFPRSINLMTVNLTQIKFHLQIPPVPKEIIALFLSYLSLRLLQMNGLAQIHFEKSWEVGKACFLVFFHFAFCLQKEISFLSLCPRGGLLKRFKYVFRVLISFS